MNLLKTGDKFMATVDGKSIEYIFLGVDLDDCGYNGTGCRYIVLKNLNDNTLTCVERLWFNQELTRRRIVRITDEQPKKER